MNFLHCKTEETVKWEFINSFFHDYCYSPSKIDVVIRPPSTSPFHHQVTILWAESKRKIFKELDKALVQLFLTIGQEGVFSKYPPPPYIAAFDAVKIIFLPYDCISQFFLESAHVDFSGTPSNYDSACFKEAHKLLAPIISINKRTYEFDAHEKELRKFIKDNILGQQTGKQMEITRNNLIAVCSRWRKEVMPTINVDWNKIRKQSKYAFVESDMFMADLLSKDNTTIIPELKIKLQDSHYIQKEKAEEALTGFYEQKIEFTDGMKAHNEFWKRYKRPPEAEMVKWVMARKDLLQPQIVRERKGSFFTPQCWVRKSQEALAEVLGEEWQEEYYIWDCCAGTGNMEVGLRNKDYIFASTIDDGDVAIMHEQINEQISNKNETLYKHHVFQFDFLNDPFFDEKDASGNVKTSKLPPALQDILRDPEKRKKLVVYINPPYAEATASKTISGNKRHKSGISTSKVYSKYINSVGRGINEVFIQFLVRIYCEIPGCIIANFSTLKNLQGQNFTEFRKFFQAKLERLFVVPANTFDNVKGEFPIGFFIWNTSIAETFHQINADIYDKNENIVGIKKIYHVDKNRVILNWMQQFYDKEAEKIAYMVRGASDFQNNRIVFLTLKPSDAVIHHSQTHAVTRNNLIQSGIFFAVRHCIAATWLNNRDQFLYPNDGWKTDQEFQSDCLVFTIFSGQNHITSKHGVNHWIPFTEGQIGTSQNFTSNFMSKFIAGEIKSHKNGDLFKDADDYIPHEKMIFSSEAQVVMDAGLAIWKYYFKTKEHLATFDRNASFYDIRKVFQGETKGKMNLISDDGYYNELIKTLREAINALALKIAGKVYDYEFLK